MFSNSDNVTVSSVSTSETSVSESVEVVAETICRRLQPLWNQYNHEGLEVRYTTGQILNEKLGTPDNRQKRGAAIVAQVAKTMNLAVSEISRMRALAGHFDSFEAFQEAHPDCTSWCDVRRLLPTLRTTEKKAPKPAKKPSRKSQPQQRVFVRTLAMFQRKLGRVALSFKPDQTEEVVNAIRNVLGILSQAGVTYEIVSRPQVSGQAA